MRLGKRMSGLLRIYRRIPLNNCRKVGRRMRHTQKKATQHPFFTVLVGFSLQNSNHDVMDTLAGLSGPLYGSAWNIYDWDSDITSSNWAIIDPDSPRPALRADIQYRITPGSLRIFFTKSEEKLCKKVSLIDDLGFVLEHDNRIVILEIPLAKLGVHDADLLIPSIIYLHCKCTTIMTRF